MSLLSETGSESAPEEARLHCGSERLRMLSAACHHLLVAAAPRPSPRGSNKDSSIHVVRSVVHEGIG